MMCVELAREPERVGSEDVLGQAVGAALMERSLR
jgi:hypothetical protein